MNESPYLVLQSLAPTPGSLTRKPSAADGSRAFGYVPLARVRRWTLLVMNSDDCHLFTPLFLKNSAVNVVECFVVTGDRVGVY